MENLINNTEEIMEATEEIVSTGLSGTTKGLIGFGIGTVVGLAISQVPKVFRKFKKCYAPVDYDAYDEAYDVTDDATEEPLEETDK